MNEPIERPCGWMRVHALPSQQPDKAVIYVGAVRFVFGGFEARKLYETLLGNPNPYGFSVRTK